MKALDTSALSRSWSGGLGVEHVLAQRLHDIGYGRDLGELLGGHDLAPILHEALVLEDGQDVFVAGDQPHASAVG